MMDLHREVATGQCAQTAPSERQTVVLQQLVSSGQRRGQRRRHNGQSVL